LTNTERNKAFMDRNALLLKAAVTSICLEIFGRPAQYSQLLKVLLSRKGRNVGHYQLKAILTKYLRL